MLYRQSGFTCIAPVYTPNRNQGLLPVLCALFPTAQAMQRSVSLQRAVSRPESPSVCRSIKKWNSTDHHDIYYFDLISFRRTCILTFFFFFEEDHCLTTSLAPRLYYIILSTSGIGVHVYIYTERKKILLKSHYPLCLERRKLKEKGEKSK